MKLIKINHKKYGYVIDFKENSKIRNSFNNLTQKTYDFDFEEWYQSGYWDDNYIPYALLDGDKVIANVSVSVIDFIVLGEKKRGVQIGTVMTDDAYRKLGLSRFLMDKVIEEWENKCDLIYLFANDSVLNFYPKFGFAIQDEYQHSMELTTENRTGSAIKFDIALTKNRDYLVQMINKSLRFSEFAMCNNASLIMFYCTSFMKDHVYYIASLDAIVIVEFEKEILYLKDVFSSNEISLDDLISEIANKETQKVVFGFTPKESDSYDVNLLEKDGTTLFILGGKDDIFRNRKIRFPLLSHA